MRRTADLSRTDEYKARIISAHAENRPSRRSWSRATRDHLRACGEQEIARAEKVLIGGSSPRMRRTGGDKRDISGRLRIISAHAENRSGADDNIRPRPDHLRACGEQPVRRQRFLRDGGSSPRMRRTEGGVVRGGKQVRIISAHAENSARRDHAYRDMQDHLRACGEQFFINRPEKSCHGSSPRMRRTVTIGPTKSPPARIISAHAENSGRLIAIRVCIADHLRACGEQPRRDINFNWKGGSSPRMRRTVKTLSLN